MDGYIREYVRCSFSTKFLENKTSRIGVVSVDKLEQFSVDKKVISLRLHFAGPKALWWPYIRVGETDSVRMCD